MGYSAWSFCKCRWVAEWKKEDFFFYSDNCHDVLQYGVSEM